VKSLTFEVVLLFILGLLAPYHVSAAEVRFTPSIGISEDFSDNVRETIAGRRAEIVTRVQPGGVLRYATSASTLEAVYNLDYRYHALKNNKDGISHSLGALGAFTLIEDFLKFDISDTFRRISLDVARDNTSESLSLDQTDQNTLSISPYILWHLGQKGVLKTGARYGDVRYWSPQGIDRRELGAFAQLTHELTTRLSSTASYSFNKTVTQSLNYEDHNLSTGLRYEYAPNSFLFGSIGNSWQAFSDDRKMSNLFWDAGLVNDFGMFLGTLETVVHYTEDPLTVALRQKRHSVKLERVMPRGTIGVSAAYSEYTDVLTGASSRNSTTISTGASREINPSLTASLNITGDKVSRRSSLDYPYHLTATGSLGYAMAHEASLGFTYTYATYRYRLNKSEGSIEINRVILQFRKAF
jgi:hypothetical protein